MGDIFSYLDEYGGYSFTEKPLGEVDAMIFSYLTYFNFDGKVSGVENLGSAVTLSSLAGIVEQENFISVTWERERSREVYVKIISCRRYRSTRLRFFVNEVDKSEEMQFSAITFELGNGDIFLAFRGTDDALVGWKEDFYMACRTPIASQKRSVTYVNQVAKHYLRKKCARFYLGGHSKGGNLAVYAAMNCKENIRHRIGRIYNLDGPGFRPDFFQELNYTEIEEKVVKLVPKESFVGMLMEESDRCILIESSEIGILQHIPTSWQITGDSFLRSEGEPERKMLYAKVNEWILSLDREKIDGFLKSLFEVVEGTETLTELTADWMKSSVSLFNTYRDMDEEMRGIFWEFCVLLVELVAKDRQERIRKWRLLDNMRKRMDNKNG